LLSSYNATLAHDFKSLLIAFALELISQTYPQWQNVRRYCK